MGQTESLFPSRPVNLNGIFQHLKVAWKKVKGGLLKRAHQIRGNGFKLKRASLDQVLERNTSECGLWALGEVAQNSCECPIPESIQGHLGGTPSWSGGKCLYGPFQLKLFYDSL